MTKEFLTDSYISYTFTPQIAEVYLAYLFKTELKMVQPFHYQDSFFVWSQPPISTQPPIMILPRGQHHPNPAWLLDFAIRPGGSVVPQQLWFPQGQGDWRRYVEQAHLQMPLFFTSADGSFGVPIVNAAAGQMVLRGGNEPAPFGDKTTTKIRIGVCVQPLAWARPSLNIHFAVARLCPFGTAGTVERSDPCKEPRDPRKVRQTCW